MSIYKTDSVELLKQKQPPKTKEAKKRPLDYRNDIKKYEDKLYTNLEDEEYMSNDLLDQALDLISIQRRYISFLEKEDRDWLNNRK